MVVLKNDDH